MTKYRRQQLKARNAIMSIPSDGDRRTNRLAGFLAVAGLLLVASGLGASDHDVTAIGGIMAALAMIISR